MALFQLRKGRDEQPPPTKPVQTVEVMRRRAMHRLIGAAVLVLAAVIGFPMLFDSQPRPIPIDLPIVIPDKNKVPPLVAPSAAQRAPASAAATALPPPAAAQTAPAPVVAAAPAPTPTAPVLVPPMAPAPPRTVEPAQPPAKANDASKAQALLDGREVVAKGTATEGRFVVQIGAFADADKVREVRQKVESAGLKTYTQVVDTKDGSRTRIRVGPFGDKAAAERAADKIRKLDLPVALLVL